jgi:hypothetical protein
VTFYGDCVKICEDFAPNFGDKGGSCCITTTLRLTLPFSPGNFVTKNNMTVAPLPPNSPDLAHCDSSLFRRLQIKLKGPHFDIIEMIEAESQAGLNTLTEHDFQDALKKWQKRWERCIRAEGDYFEVDDGQ